jgi:hypothetical protein
MIQLKKLLKEMWVDPMKTPMSPDTMTPADEAHLKGLHISGDRHYKDKSGKTVGRVGEDGQIEKVEDGDSFSVEDNPSHLASAQSQRFNPDEIEGQGHEHPLGEQPGPEKYKSADIFGNIRDLHQKNDDDYEKLRIAAEKAYKDMKNSPEGTSRDHYKDVYNNLLKKLDFQSKLSPRAQKGHNKMKAPHEMKEAKDELADVGANIASTGSDVVGVDPDDADQSSLWDMLKQKDPNKSKEQWNEQFLADAKDLSEKMGSNEAAHQYLKNKMEYLQRKNPGYALYLSHVANHCAPVGKRLNDALPINQPVKLASFGNEPVSGMENQQRMAKQAIAQNMKAIEQNDWTAKDASHQVLQGIRDEMTD